jgi:peptide-methionine (S)-S-oxide reductase
VTDTKNIERIVVGGGCFWCIEAVYKRIKGVVATRPGYAGGYVENPDYKLVCTGDTGHAEVVEISYDKTVITGEAILEVFWRAHDPTTPNRQENDVGTQYRSIILYADAAQKKLAESSIGDLVASGVYPKKPVTQVLPLETFWPAEAYHKDYFEDNRGQSYCRMVIETKLHKLALLED